MYRRFFEKIDEKKQTVIIVLDEIDTLFKKIGDDFLYNLTRANSELKNTQLTIIGITNSLSFRDNLDLRVKSSLSEEEILFRPYNAVQIKNILLDRIKQGFSCDIEENVINKCSALAAQEHGDARRALDLLRVAGELAERAGELQIREEHVDAAEEKIDQDRVTETMRNQPKQSQAVLYSIITLSNELKKKSNWVDSRLLTGDVFTAYKKVCEENTLKILTQRRISDLIGELDMLGIVTARVISKGRYGRTREISLALNDAALEKLMKFLTGVFGA